MVAGAWSPMRRALAPRKESADKSVEVVEKRASLVMWYASAVGVGWKVSWLEVGIALLFVRSSKGDFVFWWEWHSRVVRSLSYISSKKFWWSMNIHFSCFQLYWEFYFRVLITHWSARNTSSYGSGEVLHDRQLVRHRYSAIPRQHCVLEHVQLSCEVVFSGVAHATVLYSDYPDLGTGWADISS